MSTQKSNSEFFFHLSTKLSNDYSCKLTCTVDEFEDRLFDNNSRFDKFFYDMEEKYGVHDVDGDDNTFGYSLPETPHSKVNELLLKWKEFLVSEGLVDANAEYVIERFSDYGDELYKIINKIQEYELDDETYLEFFKTHTDIIPNDIDLFMKFLENKYPIIYDMIEEESIEYLEDDQKTPEQNIYEYMNIDCDDEETVMESEDSISLWLEYTEKFAMHILCDYIASDEEMVKAFYESVEKVGNLHIK